MKLAGFWTKTVRALVHGAPVVAVVALWSMAPLSRALAQDDDAGSLAGVVSGSAIVVAIGDANGLPGGTAPVPITISNTDPNDLPFQVSMNFDYPEVEGLTLNTTDCKIDPRLAETHTLSVFMNTAACMPNPGQNCIRFLVTSLQNPKPTIDDGTLLTCDFGIGTDVTLGTTFDLIADASTLQVINTSVPPMVLEATAENGVITVASPPPSPTATATHTGTPVPVTPTVTHTAGGGATPTNTPGGSTATPTHTGGATNTPGGATSTPTHTGGPTNTPGGATATPTTSGPTNTPGGATPTRTKTVPSVPTNTPNPNAFLDDDSCAITSPAQTSPLHSLVLLIVPAIILAARRRRR